MIKPYLDFYFVTDRNLCENIVESVVSAVEGGTRVIQYRDKDVSYGEMLKVSKELKKITAANGCLLIINDNVEVAKNSFADGVHIGQDDMSIEEVRRVLGEDKIIGVSVNDLKSGMEAYNNGADYLGIGPIFATKTKKDAGNAIGTNVIKDIKAKVNIPLVAIGGINEENVSEVINAGADGICAISQTLSNGNVANSVMNFRELILRSKYESNRIFKKR